MKTIIASAVLRVFGIAVRSAFKIGLLQFVLNRWVTDSSPLLSVSAWVLLIAWVLYDIAKQFIALVTEIDRYQNPVAYAFKDMADAIGRGQ